MLRVIDCDYQVAVSYNDIGNVYERQDDNENTLLQYQKSLEILSLVYGCDSA